MTAGLLVASAGKSCRTNKKVRVENDAAGVAITPGGGKFCLECCHLVSVNYWLRGASHWWLTSVPPSHVRWPHLFRRDHGIK